MAGPLAWLASSRNPPYGGNLEERMTTSRYLNAVLTLIAVELGFIAFSHSGVPVSAQTQATRVIITGVDMQRNATLPVSVRGVDLIDRKAYLPVAVYGQLELPPETTGFGPIETRAITPIRIEGTVRVEADPPLKVQIPVVTSPRPGI
jgi:hypothetical protein